MSLILIIILYLLTYSDSTTTYYLVRHAEKACEDCNACGLSQSGNVRAAALADYLSNKNIDVIFASQCLRTSRTAQPIADRLGKDVGEYHTDQLNSFIITLKTMTHKNILIVGHSNQIPIMVRALSRKRVFISDTDFDNIYIITKSSSSRNGSLRKVTYGVKTN